MASKLLLADRRLGSDQAEAMAPLKALERAKSHIQTVEREYILDFYLAAHSNSNHQGLLRNC
jgi:hypothetical protein